MEISTRDKIVFSLWLVPLAVPFGVVLWDLFSFVSPFLVRLATTRYVSTYEALSYDAVLVRFGFLVPVAFFIAWLLTRQRVDLRVFFVVSAAYVALTCGFALVNRFQHDNPTLIASSLMANCVGIIVSVVFALLRRKRVVARAVLYRSPDQREARLRKERAMGYAQATLRQKVLYSLWLLPLVASLLVALSFTALVINVYVFDPLSIIYIEGIHLMGRVVRSIGLLVVIGYMLGWLTSREREERTPLIISAVAYIVLTALTLLLETQLLWELCLFVCVIGFAWVIAACVWAITRRKEVVGRAVLHRSSKRRESKKLEERQLLASEKAAMANGRGQGGGKAGMWPRSKKRTLEAPDTVPAQEEKGTPGSALAAAVGSDRRAPSEEAGVVPTSVGDALIQPKEPAEAKGVSAPSSTPTSEPVGATAHNRPEPSQRTTTTRDTTPSANAEQVDVNSCTATEMLSLPGMTAAVARSIVSKREEGGPYASVEQLVARNGLKPHEVAPFLRELTVSVPSAEPVGTRRVRMLDL